MISKHLLFKTALLDYYYFFPLTEIYIYIWHYTLNNQTSASAIYRLKPEMRYTVFGKLNKHTKKLITNLDFDFQCIDVKVSALFFHAAFA